MMAIQFFRRAGGHRFNFSHGVCLRCGISREEFEDGGRPWCTGQRPTDDKEHLPINSDGDPPAAA